MYVSPEFDENQMKQLNESISLVNNNIKLRNKGHRKMFVVYPTNREPLVEVEKKMHVIDVSYTTRDLAQVKRFPKLKMFYPELVIADVSLNLPPPPLMKIKK
jgi:hypothetical protein